MRRLSTFLIAAGGVFLIGGPLVGGSESVGLAFVFFAVSLVVLVLGLVLRRVASHRAHQIESRWSAPAAEVFASGSPSTLDRPRGRAVWSLGVVETRELVSSPWFAVGVALTLLELLLFGFVWGQDYSEHWWGVASALTLFVHPFVGMLVIAGHRAGTRSRRDGCAELFSTCPVDEGGRVSGQLVPALLAGPLAAAFATAMFVVATSQPEVFGAIDGRAWLIAATCGVLGAGGLALGVALGRWAPFFLAPVLALIAIVVVDSRLLEVGGVRWATDRYLATFDPGDGPDQLLLDLPVAERLVWFTGLTMVVVAIALVGRRRWALPALVLGAATAVVAALGVTAPMSGTAERAAHLVDPGSDEQCLEVGGATAPVELCGPAEYRGATSQYATGLAPVAAALPTASGPVRFRMRLFDGPEAELPAELAKALPAGFTIEARARARDGEPLAFEPATHASAIRAARYRLVAASLGLPTEADSESELPKVVAGQADGVVVLWMGTLGLGANERLDAFRPDHDEHVVDVFDATVRGQAWPDPCWDGAAPLTWAPEDLEAARRLVSLPDQQVLDVVHRRWSQLDTMSTDDLLVAVGLDPVGPTSDVESRAHDCPY